MSFASASSPKPAKEHINKPWWCEEIEKAIKIKKYHQNRLQRQPTLENLINFRKARSKSRVLIRQKKEELLL